MVSYLGRGPAISDLDTFFYAFYDKGDNAQLSESFLLLPTVAALDHQVT